VLMIEHLISDVRSFCPRVVVLVDSSVVADGATAEVLRDDRVIEAYLSGLPYVLRVPLGQPGRPER